MPGQPTTLHAARRLPLLVALALGMAPALAQAPPTTATPAARPNAFAAMTQAPLTADRINALIKSFPDVKKSADAIKAKYKIADRAGTGTTDSFAVLMGVAAVTGELNGVVAKYGFKDFPDWLAVMLSTTTAIAYVGSDAAGDGMAKAIAAIQANTSLSADQKQKAIAAIQAQGALIPKPPQQNIDAVKPYVAELKLLFK
ncbi:MAG: hypothetical protein U1E56_06905 [Bauldia sp.]